MAGNSNRIIRHWACSTLQRQGCKHQNCQHFQSKAQPRGPVYSKDFCHEIAKSNKRIRT
jgi:hypothetical protein